PLLGVDGPPGRRGGMGAVGDHELRQGPAHAGGPHRARRSGGPLPGCPHRGERAMSWVGPIEPAVDPEALAEVAEHALRELAERADAVAAFLAEGVAGQDGAGYCDTLAAAVAVATTGGRRARGRWTRATVDGIFLAEPEGAHTPAGYGHRTSVRLEDVTAGAG